jgi:spermidine synthase
MHFDHVQVLFQQPFFEYMHRSLKAGGCVCTQAESLWLHMPIIESLASMCKKVFDGGSVQYAYTTIPTYPSGQIGFMLCSKKTTGSTGPLDTREPRRQLAGGLCKYYRPELHKAAFVLPQFAKEALASKLTYAA